MRSLAKAFINEFPTQGASSLFVFGVLPQVITAWIAVVLYRFEVSLRSATVLDMVGAAARLTQAPNGKMTDWRGIVRDVSALRSGAP